MDATLEDINKEVGNVFSTWKDRRENGRAGSEGGNQREDEGEDEGENDGGNH